MWQNLRIKWKLMMSFVLVVVLPMAVAIFFIIGIISEEISSAHKEMSMIVAQNVSRMIEDAKEKSLNYVRLLVRDPLLRSSTYYSVISDDRAQLVQTLTQTFKVLDLDIMEVGDKKGKVMVRGHRPADYGDNKTGQKIVGNALSGKMGVDIETGKGGYAIRAVGPIAKAEEWTGPEAEIKIRDIIGTIMTGVYIDDKFLNNIKELTKINMARELSLILDNKIAATTNESLRGKEIDKKIGEEIDKTKDMVYGQITVDKKPYIAVYIPLKGMQDQLVGAILFALSTEDIAKAQAKTSGLLFLIIGIAAVFAVVIGYLIAINISNPLDRVVNNLTAIASGEADLSQKIPVKSKDEVGKLSTMFNTLMDSLATLISQIRVTADKVSTSSEGLSSSAEELNASTEEISSTIQQIAKGVTTQAERVEETSKIMEQMTSSVKHVTDNTIQAAAASEQATKRSALGETATKEAVEKMKRITESVTDAARVIQTLGEKSQQIGEITETITSVADQTNLLALNAAIEAARAGDAGRGFAVVAEEVRKLAEGSAEAARNIGNLIKGIQQETTKAVTSIEAGTKEVVEGQQIVQKVSAVFSDIRKAIEQVAQMVSEISRAAQEQQKGTDQVVKAVDDIASVAEESASATEEASSSAQEQTASMEEMSSSAQELAQMAMDLRDLVGKFKLSEKTTAPVLKKEARKIIMPGVKKEIKRETPKPKQPDILSDMDKE